MSELSDGSSGKPPVAGDAAAGAPGSAEAPAVASVPPTKAAREMVPSTTLTSRGSTGQGVMADAAAQALEAAGAEGSGGGAQVGAAVLGAGDAPLPMAPSSESSESSPPSGPGSVPPSAPSVLQVLAPHLSEEHEVARRKDKRRGLIIIGTTFVGCILLSLWGKEASEPMEAPPLRPPTTVGVVGWPKQVDVTATLAAARETTPRDQLRGFVAEQVSSDGTVNLKKNGALVRYSFQSGPGEGPQPKREPTTLGRHSYCGRQNVYIRRHGMVAEEDMAAFPCGSQLKEPLPDPGCSLKQVWDFMIHKRGAPQGRPARIEYYMAKQEPAYRFTLPGTKHRVSLSADCARVLSPAEGLGGVP